MICGRGEARPLSCRKDLMSIFCDDFSSRTFTFYIAHAKDMKIKYNQNLSFPSSVISKNMYQTWPSGQNVTLITVNNNNSPKEPRNDWGILTIIFKQKVHNLGHTSRFQSGFRERFSNKR